MSSQTLKRSLQVVTSVAFLLSVALAAPLAQAVSYTWDNSNGNRNWDTANNWTADSGYPSSSADTATFNSTGAGDVNLNGSKSVGTVTFTDTYTLKGSSDTLTVGTLFKLATNSKTVTVQCNLAGAGGLTVGQVGVGNGTIILSGTNTYSGATTIDPATLQCGAVNTLSPNSAITMGGSGFGATLSLMGYDQTISSLSASGYQSVVENGGAANAILTINQATNTIIDQGTIQNGSGGGTLAVVKDGIGSMTWKGGHFTFTGGLTIKGGKIIANDDSTLTGRAVNIDGGELNMAPSYGYVGAITLTSGSITGNKIQATSYAVRSGDISAKLSETGGSATLTKSTSGMVTMSNSANEYSGATLISAGMILVKIAGALPSTSAVTVQNSATLAMDTGVTLTKTATWNSGSILGGKGTYDIAGGFTPPSGVHVSPGLIIGTLTVDGALNLASGGILDIQVDGATADLLNITNASDTGNLTLTGGTLNVTAITPGTFTSIPIVTYAGTRNNTTFATVNLPSAAYSIQYDDANKRILLLPEPATMALLALGGVGMLIRRRRR